MEFCCRPIVLLRSATAGGGSLPLKQKNNWNLAVIAVCAGPPPLVRVAAARSNAYRAAAYCRLPPAARCCPRASSAERHLRHTHTRLPAPCPPTAMAGVVVVHLSRNEHGFGLRFQECSDGLGHMIVKVFDNTEAARCGKRALHVAAMCMIAALACRPVTRTRFIQGSSRKATA